MSDRMRDRLRDDRAHEKTEIQSWLDGQGSVIMGIFLMLLFVWAIASPFVVGA